MPLPFTNTQLDYKTDIGATRHEVEKSKWQPLISSTRTFRRLITIPRHVREDRATRRISYFRSVTTHARQHCVLHPKRNFSRAVLPNRVCVHARGCVEGASETSAEIKSGMQPAVTVMHLASPMISHRYLEIGEQLVSGCGLYSRGEPDLCKLEPQTLFTDRQTTDLENRYSPL